MEFGGKRMYGSNSVQVTEPPTADGDNRVHMASQTLNVKMERFVSNHGANNIPHQIAVGMTKAREMVADALEQLTPANFMDENHRLPNAFHMVYRQTLPAHIPAAAADRRKKQEASIREMLVTLREKVTKLRIGLGKDQVIKISDKLAAPNGPHYLGVVKNLKRGEQNNWGHIEVGYRAFRDGAWLPRILIHEAAHKYTDATDGPNTAGYWNANFTDYLDPASMTPATCMNNADSHALFIWALTETTCADQEMPGQFAATMNTRWLNTGLPQLQTLA